MWKGDQEQALIASSAMWMKPETRKAHLHTDTHFYARVVDAPRGPYESQTPLPSAEPQSICSHFSTLVSSAFTCTAWCISNALLRFQHAVWPQVCFLKIQLCVAADLTLSSTDGCCRRYLMCSLRQCFVLSRPIRAQMEYLQWWYRFKLVKTSSTSTSTPWHCQTKWD